MANVSYTAKKHPETCQYAIIIYDTRHCGISMKPCWKHKECPKVEKACK